jgi:cbb3-type cytochrome oxidase subunit 3
VSHILKEITRGAGLGWLMGITTAVFFLTFLYWAWWAYNSQNRARMEADSRLPLNDGADL